MHATRKVIAATNNLSQPMSGATFKTSLRDWRARYKAQRAAQPLAEKSQNQTPSS